MKYECRKLAQKFSFMHAIDQFRIFHYLFRKQAITKEPENLYEPIASHIRVRGKRIRPVLINDYRGFNGDYKKRFLLRWL
jgi:geranylgeranyl diphosphate synthase type II